MAAKQTTVKRPPTPNEGYGSITIDQIVSHWLVKVIGGLLLALVGYVYDQQLESIFNGIQAQTDAVSALKADLSEFKTEQRTYQSMTAAQYTGLETRVGSLERGLRELREESADRLEDWKRSYQKWLEREMQGRR